MLPGQEAGSPPKLLKVHSRPHTPREKEMVRGTMTVRPEEWKSNTIHLLARLIVLPEEHSSPKANDTI